MAMGAGTFLKAASVAAFQSNQLPMPPVPQGGTWPSSSSGGPLLWPSGKGADAVIGTAVPAGVGPEIYRRWLRRHELTEGHPHVHGANLGFRADVYLRAGGFPDCAAGEDVKLVERIRAITPRWVATHHPSVRTSGRIDSRVEGGFASFLAELDAELGEEAI